MGLKKMVGTVVKLFPLLILSFGRILLRLALYSIPILDFLLGLVGILGLGRTSGSETLLLRGPILACSTLQWLLICCPLMTVGCLGTSLLHVTCMAGSATCGPSHE